MTESNIRKNLIERFRLLNDAELLRVIYLDSDQYEHAALECARMVLGERRLSEERIQEIREELELDAGADEPVDVGQVRWAKVKLFPGRLYGEQMQDILRQEGIPSILKGDDVGIFGPGAGSGASVLGVMLWVPEQFEDRARELVEAYLDGL